MLGAVVVSIAVTCGAVVVSHAGIAAFPQQPPAPAAQTPPEQPWPPAGVVRLDSGIAAPRLIKESKPRYTDNARRAKIEGVVIVEAVVGTDGKISHVRVKRSLDKEYGLDDEAVNTVKKWAFSPAKRDGVAIPVLVDIELSFTLRR